MFKFVILLSVVACAFGAAIPEGLIPQLDGRIVGGTATTISSFPWQISLQRNGGHSCGGSIYSSRIIVTAAHCLQSVSASSLQVRVGSSYWNSGGSVHKVAAFRNHEGYNANTMVNDIAVIRLSSNLAMSSVVKAIGLASSAPGNGAAASVSGWGTQSSGVVPQPETTASAPFLGLDSAMPIARTVERKLTGSMRMMAISLIMVLAL